MSRTVCCAALALLALPQLAVAGAVQWGYRAVDDHGTVLREMTGLTETYWSDFFFTTDPRESGTFVPDPNPNNDLRTDTWRNQATVHITDLPSGDIGSVEIYWDYFFQYEWRNGEWDPYYEGYRSGPWPAHEMVLGTNHYSVRGLGGELLVTVTPLPTSNTPEPGTLALAGLGLGGVGLVRRLRRKM